MNAMRSALTFWERQRDVLDEALLAGGNVDAAEYVQVSAIIVRLKALLNPQVEVEGLRVGAARYRRCEVRGTPGANRFDAHFCVKPAGHDEDDPQDEHRCFCSFRFVSPVNSVSLATSLSAPVTMPAEISAEQVRAAVEKWLAQ